jgi:hypothetical protein
MEVLERFIHSIELDEPQSAENILTIYFCHGGNGNRLKVLNFDEALNAGLQVKEFGTGDVSQLMFDNKGDLPVFVPEGTIIEGLKQSRSIRISLIVKKNQELLVPTHCIEQGRWTKPIMGRKSAYHLNAKLRASNLKHSSASLREKRGLDSSGSQRDTWENIRAMKEKKEREKGRHLANDEFVGDVYREDGERIQRIKQTFVCPETAVGLLAMIDNRVCLDIFGSEKLFKRNYEALLSGLAIEALNGEPILNHKVMTPDEFLRSILTVEKESYKSIGHGTDVRFENDSIVGCALTGKTKVYHLEAFRV